MVNLHICGVDKLATTIAKTNPDLVISITDPEKHSISRAMREMRGYEGPVISLDFIDLDHMDRHNRSFSMTKGHIFVDELDEFFPNQDGTIVVHCTMGVSRSTAMAIFALSHIVARVQSPSAELAKEIVDQVYEAAPKAKPNMMVLEIADHIVKGYDGACVRAVFDRRGSDHSECATPAAPQKIKTKKLKRKAFRP